MVCESVGKADLLSDRFDGKHSRESVDLPLTCHLSLSLTSFAFRSSEFRRLLLDLDPYGGSDPLGMFPPFLMRTADVLAPHLSDHLGSFPCSWRQADVIPYSKWSTVLLCSQLPTDFHNICIVQGFCAPGVGSHRTIHGTHRCDSNHPVCLSGRSGYL